MLHLVRRAIAFLPNRHYSGKSNNAKAEHDKEEGGDEEVGAREAIVAPDDYDGDEADGEDDVVKVGCVGDELLFAGGVFDNANGPVSNGDLEAELEKSEVDVEGLAFGLVNICFHF